MFSPLPLHGIPVSILNALEEPTCRTVVGDSPQSLWDKVFFVSEQPVHGLGYGTNWLPLVDMEDIECRSAIPQFISNLLC
jgi:hypothetical protein